MGNNQIRQSRPEFFRLPKRIDITRDVARAKAHPSAVLIKPSPKQAQIAGQVVPYICKNTDYKRNYLIFSDNQSVPMEQLPEILQSKNISDPVDQFGILRLCAQAIYQQRGENPTRLPLTLEALTTQAKSSNQKLLTMAGLAALEKDPKQLPRILLGKTAAPAPEISHARPPLKMHDHLRHKETGAVAQKETRPVTTIVQTDNLLQGAFKGENMVRPETIVRGLEQNNILYNIRTA